MDLAEFSRNRAAFPPEKLIPFMGQHVAWALSGREILAHASDLDGLLDQLDRRGIKPGTYVLSYVPEGTSYMGGASL
jgi:hypothetical protein